MAKGGMISKIGTWAFILGIIIALVIGLYQATTIEGKTAYAAGFFGTDNGGIVAWILAALGAIVGILAALGRGTITKNETPGFLVAGIALVVMYGVFRGISLTPWLGSLLIGVSMALSIFVAPAVGILAIKAVWDMGKDV